MILTSKVHQTVLHRDQKSDRGVVEIELIDQSRDEHGQRLRDARDNEVDAELGEHNDVAPSTVIVGNLCACHAEM